jgi:hypothetical protein
MKKMIGLNELVDKMVKRNRFSELERNEQGPNPHGQSYTKYSRENDQIREVPILNRKRQTITLNDQPSETNDQFFTQLNGRRTDYPSQSFVCDDFSTLPYQDQFQMLDFPFHGPSSLDYCEVLSSLGHLFG